MGVGQIVSGGPDGRYTIMLDFGAATRTSALAQLTLAMNKLQTDLAYVQTQIAAAETALLPLLTAYEAAVNDYITAATTFRLTGALPPGTPSLNTAAIDFQWAEIRRRRGAMGPLTRNRDAIKFRIAVVLQEIAKWNALNVTSTRGAWCVDLTENAQVGWYVATCDIPGDSNLVLLAAGCRGWRLGDGAVSATDKAFVLLNLTARLLGIEVQMLTYQTKQASAEADEIAQTAALAAARAAYKADPTPANKLAENTALKKLTATQRTILLLRGRYFTAAVRRGELLVQEARWQARPAVTPPDAGDGILTARGVMSPEQAFWNVAVLPGWQKFKPTYRWGTAAAIDYDADTMTVDLFDQRSDAQRLPINQSDTLFNVPVVYMTCNAEAFNLEDRVVVQFLNQNWETPRVIGFLDNPKPCLAWPTVHVTVAFNTTIGASPGTRGWFGGKTTSACGDTYVGYYATPAIAPPASHVMSLSSIAFSGSANGATTINSTVNVGEVFWTASSNAYQQSPGIGVTAPQKAPQTNVGTWYYLRTDVSEEMALVLLRTINSTEETLTSWGGSPPGCVALFTATGGYATSDVVTKAIDASGLITNFLTSLGKLPTISVVRGSATKQYAVDFETSINTSGNQDNNTWTIAYKAVE